MSIPKVAVLWHDRIEDGDRLPRCFVCERPVQFARVRREAPTHRAGFGRVRGREHDEATLEVGCHGEQWTYAEPLRRGEPAFDPQHLELGMVVMVERDEGRSVYNTRPEFPTLETIRRRVAMWAHRFQTAAFLYEGGHGRAVLTVWDGSDGQPYMSDAERLYVIADDLERRLPVYVRLDTHRGTSSGPYEPTICREHDACRESLDLARDCWLSSRPVAAWDDVLAHVSEDQGAT